MRKCHIKSKLFLVIFLSLSECEKAVLVNSDRFLIITGQRNYFFQQKENYKNEIVTLSNIINRNNIEKKNYE